MEKICHHTGSSECEVDSRKGVALILVLAFLGFLMVLAVTLLIVTRTERIVADANIEAARAKQILLGAIPSAVQDLNNFMWTPNIADRMIHLPDVHAVIESQTQPGFPVASGLGNKDQVLNLSPVQMISGEGTNWIPRKYLSAGVPDFNAQYIASNDAAWVFITDPEDPDDRIIGRYGYVFVDCTGLLDINLIATNPVEGYHHNAGQSMGEVDLSDLPDVTKANSVDEMLRKDRKKYYHFDTFPEMLHMCSNYVAKGKSSNLVPYSHSYDNGWWDWDSSTWMMGDVYAVNMDVSAWGAGDAEVVFANVFGSKPGYSPHEMGLCFGDYIDANSIPASTAIPCCEDVPMINELSIQGFVDTFVQGPDVFTRYRMELIIEFWNPVIQSQNNETYTVSVMEGDWTIRTRGGVSFVPEIDPNSPPTDSFQADPSDPYKTLTFSIPSLDQLVSDLGANQTIAGQIRGIRIVVTGGEGVVDEVFRFDPLNIPPLPVPLLGDPSGSAPPQFEACIDPRYNHVQQSWTIQSGGSIDGMNNGLPRMNISNNGDREGLNLFVRNGPMQSVTELGYIPAGGTSYWTSIDLFSPQGRELMTKYRVGKLEDRTNTVGLINPNTTSSNVIFAAFKDTPIERYPGDPQPARFAYNDISALNEFAGQYVDETKAGDHTGKKEYDSSAAWVTCQALQPGSLFSDTPGQNHPYAMNNTEKESFIRNSFRMFNPNQNLYTLYVVAQAINDQGKPGTWDGEMVDRVSGERRAVALIWRDPFPSPFADPSLNPRPHDFLIRQFRYLDE